MLAGFKSLRAGWAVVLVVEVGILGSCVACRRCWVSKLRYGDGDEDEDGADGALVGEVDGESGRLKGTVVWSADWMKEGEKEEGVVGMDRSGFRHA